MSESRCDVYGRAIVQEGTPMKPNVMHIERKRLKDQIIDQLIAMISNGSFKPGDKLPSETALMALFGVGRSSLREAIGALSLIGVLTVRPGHGTHVAPSAADSSFSKPLRWGMFMGWRERLHEFIEARITLEQTLVGFAAERATETDIEEIRRGLNLLKSPKLTKRKAIEADLVFHVAIAAASHNSVLARFLEELRQPVKNWMEQKASLFGGYDQVYEQHEAIFNAILARDPATAQKAIRDHLAAVGERMTAALLERRAG
jgi:GntR family transcriptional regulator, transcriptional repressor for pyruvate dehydrogenase complex